jgi:hypothetical protein
MKTDSRLDPLWLLTCIFITLKLCGVIDWSWKWVMSPIWIPLTLAFVIAVCYGIGLVMPKRNTPQR